MSAVRKPEHTVVLKGKPRPRVSPPTPARADVAGFRETAAEMGITLMPWQETAARFITAVGPGKRRLYREVCLLVARQQGKTTLMKPHIIRELRGGRKVMHIAQNRELPREMFGLIADTMAETDSDLFPRRRGKIIWPRYGSGQEEIVLTNGGGYRIAAAGRGGARGHANDTVIIDELREMETFDVVSAAEPTLTMSRDPQMIYLSNAGHDESVVLNSVRDRAGKDEALAYLEWSADPQRAADDPAGWSEANPALGHYPSVLRTLETAYRKAQLSGNLSIFETEHLCRWVTTMRERLVDEYEWSLCRSDAPLEDQRRPFMAVSMSPDGSRASAAIAWQRDDDMMGLRLVFDVTGSPIDTDALGRDMREFALRHGVPVVGFDPVTDSQLAKSFRKTESISGLKWANATARFVTIVKAKRLLWDDADQVTDDLTWTARKPHDESGSYQAVRANDDRPITAALASIRAVWLASTGQKPAAPKVM